MSTTLGIGVPCLAVLLAFAALIIPRHPKVMAWRKRRQESRMLAPTIRRSLPAKFLTGPMPAHDSTLMTRREEAEFEWITNALKASQRATRP